MRVRLFGAHCFLFPKFYLILVKHSDGYGGTDNQKDLPVLPRRVPEHDRRQTLWAIILVKLFILFAILKVFFFPDFLAGQSPEERSRSVMKELTPDK